MCLLDLAGLWIAYAQVAIGSSWVPSDTTPPLLHSAPPKGLKKVSPPGSETSRSVSIRLAVLTAGLLLPRITGALDGD